MSDKIDTRLVERCLDGDTRAFEELVGRYQKTLFNGALRIVRDYQNAQDVTQGTLVKVYEKLSTYSPKHKFFSWIYRIMVNEALNLMEKRKSHLDLSSGIESPDKTPEEHYSDLEQHRFMQDALMQLRPENRAVVVLRYFASLSYRELAYVFNLPEKTVKSRLFESRKRLCCLLSEKRISAND